MILLLPLTLLFILSLFVGGGSISFSIFDNPTEQLIFWDLRVPRTFICLFAGMSLGLSGCILQSLLRNPLAEPYTLGISGGATLGASFAIALGIQPLWILMPTLSFISCLGTSFLLLYIGIRSGTWSSKTIILIGLMISLFCGAAVTFVLNLLQPNKLSLAIQWLSGQTGSLRDQWWPLLAVFFVISLCFFYKNSSQLDKMLLGESVARNLKVNLKKFRYLSLIMICGLTAICVSITGLIGFLGLIAPHCAKFLLKNFRHSQLILLSSLLGGILLLIADILIRWLNWSVTTGSLVALLGAPILIYLLSKRTSHVAA